MKNRTLLFAAALLFAISPVIAGNQIKSQMSQTNIASPEQCGVTYDQIYQYMFNQGIVVTAFIDIEGSCNVYCKSTTGKLYIVYVLDGIIVGHDDTDF